MNCDDFAVTCALTTQVRRVMVHHLPNGRAVQLLVDEVALHGLARALERAGFGPDRDPPRLIVKQDGIQVGTVPADFDPEQIVSTNWLYRPRPTDFVRRADHWEASWSMGPSDLQAVCGLIYEPKP